MIRLRYIGRDEAELETGDKIVLFSYAGPIAYYHREKDQHFQTEEKLSPSSQKHLEKWLRSRNAIGKTVRLPQYSLEAEIDGK